jgi:hypothetical protein
LRRISLIIVFLFLFIEVRSQNTGFRKKVFFKNSTILFEEYDVSDSLSANKDGYFARYYRSGKLKMSGSYINNLPTGMWSYYNDSSQLIAKYNYTSALNVMSVKDTLATYYLRIAGMDTNLYASYEKVPEFIGSYIGLNDFLAQNLRYPHIAKQNNIEGYVIACFYVNSLGYIESPKIVKGLSHGCDDEVLRVINLMPRWIPARRQNADIKCLYYMAFKFEIKK